MHEVEIRDATAADIGPVRRLRAASWQAAYAGILPPVYLEAMDTGPEEIARAVRGFLRNPPDRHLLVAERGGRIVAFANCGPERPTIAHLRGGVLRGEVYALYAHPDAWSTGAGAPLLTAALERLRADGREQSVLWVLEANARARAFYERQGLRPTGERTTIRLGGALLPELEYATVPGAERVVSQRTELPAPLPAPIPIPIRRGA
ncbi:GNAT family N-acetyltransferase [Streptacidiphilus carbonis]|uniref:GNAT family N-acetyltransferase n=1 Tax=Streptacidiphilus carbonis TaxID=105422 RepID=UPI000694FB3E|nr:GNAT family N-acetyltransferase [Streptacidiphilus carbonis]